MNASLSWWSLAWPGTLPLWPCTPFSDFTSRSLTGTTTHPCALPSAWISSLPLNKFTLLRSDPWASLAPSLLIPRTSSKLKKMKKTYVSHIGLIYHSFLWLDPNRWFKSRIWIPYEDEHMIFKDISTGEVFTFHRKGIWSEEGLSHPLLN